MSRPFDFGEIKLTAGGDGSSANPQEDTPFRIAVLGDFSGRSGAGRASASVGSRRPVLVDRDNFDSVLAKIAPELSLPISDRGAFTLRFSELDDFHPDRLFEQVAIFRRLREVRLRLNDPATFAAAAEELGLKLEPLAAARPIAPPAPARVVSASKVQQR